MKPRGLTFELTPRCNQQCGYCYNAWRGQAAMPGAELSTDEVRGLVDLLLAETALSQVTLSGGEPLLRADLFEIVDHLNERGLPVALISNGGLVTEEIAKQLAARQVTHLQITLAGPSAQLHDAVCGPGAFARTIRGVAHLVNQGVKTSSSFLCTRQNYRAAGETLERLHGLGANHHYCFNRFNPSGHGRHSLTTLLPSRSQVLEALRQADDFAARRGIRIHSTMPIPCCMVDEAEFPRIEFGQCSVGTEQAEYAVNCRGELKLCPLQATSLGSLLASKLSELQVTEPAQRFREGAPAFCQECPHRSACLGGCRAAAEWVFGRAAELDPFLAQHVMPDYETHFAVSKIAPFHV
jgi:radical SAM protein with 4Fe4S-binding SPASM domain